MNFPFEQKIEENKIVRTFSPDVDSEELVWHRDRRDRTVTIIKSGDWQYQSEDELPIKLVENQKLFIPKESWHRVIKGNNELIVEIVES